MLEEGSGRKYLIQHSAGSGKTNSIVWTAHQLADLHDAQDEKTFFLVVVLSDRNVIGTQSANGGKEMDDRKLGLPRFPLILVVQAGCFERQVSAMQTRRSKHSVREIELMRWMPELQFLSRGEHHNRFSPQLRERAVRLALDNEAQQDCGGRRSCRFVG